MNRLLRARRWLLGVRCGECGDLVMRYGEMTGVAFVISPEGDVLCEPCARLMGLWSDPLPLRLQSVPPG